MKNLIRAFSFGMLVFAMTSCSSTTTDSTKTETGTEQTGKEYTSAYICPMHCEGSGSDAVGKCPVCGMDYVKNEGTGDAEHSHDDGHNHEGHSH